MKRIGILYGGKTGEHEVSCRSAASVLDQLDPSLYEPILIGIDDEGVWYLQKETIREKSDGRLSVVANPEHRIHALPGRGLGTRDGDLAIDFVFPVLHGTFGEDGTVQGLLEVVELPYAGANVMGSAVGMDKIAAKRLWQQAGLPVVPYLEVTKEQLRGAGAFVDGISRRVESELRYPVFVKPVCAGSSVGVSRVETAADLGPALELALRFDTRALVEREIRGKEVECSVVGNRDPRAFTPGEIVPVKHAFYDYDAKYVDPDGAQLLIPAELPQDKLEEIKSLAKSGFAAAYAIGMARIDFLVEGTDGAAYLNEINTIPGFTNISMFSRMCGADGVTYPELLTKIIELGLEHFRERRAIEFKIAIPEG